MAGNIVKVKEGSYRLRYRGHSKYVQAKGDREAERLLAKFVIDIDGGDFTKSDKITFKQFAEKWLTEYADVDLAPKTVFRYRELLESRIYPELGDKRLDKIKPLDLVSFYNMMRKEHKYIGKDKDGSAKEKVSTGLSEKTIKHHHDLISAIYEKAIRWGVLKGDNPTQRVDAPRPEKKEAKYYDEEQTLTLLEALGALSGNELKYRVACVLAIISGARLGEVMGIEWRDINFDKKLMEIRRASQYIPKIKTFTKKPKTEKSKRKISVNDMLLSLLEEYREYQREKGFHCEGNGRLFVTWDGKPMHTYTLSDWFPEFLRRNNLPHLNVHGLRHTCATFLISRGMDIQTVAGRLGHSTSATTHNIYSHFLESKDRQAADLMEAAFRRKQED